MSAVIVRDQAEEATRRPADYAERTPLDELRRDEERKRDSPLKFVSYFPWIGRGSVMRDCLVSHQEAEAAYDDAIERLRSE